MGNLLFISHSHNQEKNQVAQTVETNRPGLSLLSRSATCDHDHLPCLETEPTGGRSSEAGWQVNEMV